MRLQEHFKNAISYARGVEVWVKKFYENVSGRELEYTFPMDFAIADWYGKKEVLDTYDNVKNSWLGDYKAFTEVVISLSYLSYAHDQLGKQGFEGRDEFIDLYSELFEKARNDFYDKYGNNDEACRYFFELTD